MEALVVLLGCQRLLIWHGMETLHIERDSRSGKAAAANLRVDA
jgi:hypothetical protein